MVPSGPRSATTSRGPRRTGRTGAAGAGSGRRSLWVIAMAALAAHRLWRAFFQKGLEPGLGLVVTLSDRGDQRLGQVAAGGVRLGAAREPPGDRANCPRRLSRAP